MLDVFLPNLAGSLHNLSVPLEEVGKREEALATVRDAVGIRRKLATASPTRRRD
jgi:hypothetical protein